MKFSRILYERNSSVNPTNNASHAVSAADLTYNDLADLGNWAVLTLFADFSDWNTIFNGLRILTFPYLAALNLR